MWDKRAEYLSNKDGNTIKMVLDQGFGDTKLVDIRLLGVNAPYLTQPGGPECQEFLSEWINNNNPSQTRWSYIVTTFRMRRTDREQVSSNRYVAVVTNMTNTSNLNAELAEFIQTKGYVGGA